MPQTSVSERLSHIEMSVYIRPFQFRNPVQMFRNVGFHNGGRAGGVKITISNVVMFEYWTSGFFCHKFPKPLRIVFLTLQIRFHGDY